MQPSVRLLNLGDTAVTVEFGDRVDPLLMPRVSGLDAALQALLQAGEAPGLIETVPTFRSLTVIFDPLVTARPDVDALIQRALQAADTQAAPPGRTWRLPVLYGGEFGPDLASVAEATGLSCEEVIARHSGTPYRVYMLGFLPGFPFMGDVAPPLALPRRSEPRVRVPAGSVAIAGGLTAIYPWESPGGWHLLGRCPVRLFDPARPAPSLLAPGDQVIFTAVEAAHYAEIDAELRSGAREAASFLDLGAAAQ